MIAHTLYLLHSHVSFCIRVHYIHYAHITFIKHTQIILTAHTHITLITHRHYIRHKHTPHIHITFQRAQIFEKLRRQDEKLLSNPFVRESFAIRLFLFFVTLHDAIWWCNFCCSCCLTLPHIAKIRCKFCQQFWVYKCNLLPTFHVKFK